MQQETLKLYHIKASKLMGEVGTADYYVHATLCGQCAPLVDAEITDEICCLETVCELCKTNSGEEIVDDVDYDITIDTISNELLLEARSERARRHFNNKLEMYGEDIFKDGKMRADFKSVMKMGEEFGYKFSYEEIPLDL